MAMPEIPRCHADINDESEVGERFDLEGGQFQICKSCYGDGRREL